MKKHKIKFLQKPSCTTCRKAKLFLEKHGAELELRSLDEQRLSESELQELIGERDYIPFLSTRNELYRSRNMKEKAAEPQRSHKTDGRQPQPHTTSLGNFRKEDNPGIRRRGL